MAEDEGSSFRARVLRRAAGTAGDRAAPGGAVVERGTHAELVARGGLYAELYGLQATAYGAWSRVRTMASVGARLASGAAAAALTAFGAFEAWNHETDAWPFLAGAAAPLLLPARARGSTVPPFWLGIGGFFAPHGHRLQVAALGWSAQVFARRALGG